MEKEYPGGIIIRRAKREDIHAIKVRIRSEDGREVIAAGNPSVYSALEQSFTRSSECFTVERHSVPLAMFGIVQEGPLANVWMLGAVGMREIKKSFVKISRLVIAEFLVRYPVMWNSVDARYTGAVRWLESCGAHFGASVQMKGAEFKTFYFRRV